MTPKQNSLYWREWAAVRKIDPEADRHQLHRDALGSHKSHKDFTNADLDKVLAAFRAITKPASLNAQLRQQDQPRTRLLWWIKHNCSLNYVTALAKERFGTANWESLPFAQLQQLHITLKNRPRASAHRPSPIDHPASPNPHESQLALAGFHQPTTPAPPPAPIDDTIPF